MTDEPTSIITALKPAAALNRYVAGYWLVHDPDGAYADQLISTLPVPGCVLGVNLADPNRYEDQFGVPTVGVLGLHRSKITYRASSHTKFAMAVLTFEGCVAILDGAAAEAVGGMAELEMLLRSSASDRLRSAMLAAPHREAIAAIFDHWINDQISPRAVDRACRIGAAARRLEAHSVDQVARELGLSRRQLHRIFINDLGIGPKAVASLNRFANSVSGLANTAVDPVAGYADQAHQIRDWRARAGVSPGRYAAAGPSELARQFLSASPDALSFYV